MEFSRRKTQKVISFPAMPDEIDRDMLATVNSHATDDDSRVDLDSIDMQQSREESKRSSPDRGPAAYNNR